MGRGQRTQRVEAGRSATDAVRRHPGPAVVPALQQLIDDLDDETVQRPGRSVAGPPGVGPLSAVVDAVVGAQRLAGWSLWVELAAIAKLITAWRGAPPILDERLGPDPCEPSNPSLAARLQRVIWQIDVMRPWGSPPLDTAELADDFVQSEIAAATGLSFYRARQRVDAAVTLFLTDRLPRTAALLHAGLLDWTKLRTILSATAELDDQTCRTVEARIIPESDVAVADSLDVYADPTRPGDPLPTVTRMTNPALERELRRTVQLVDAAAAARRAQKARDRRTVTAKALDDGMGRLEVETGQEIVAAIVGDLDAQVASAKAAGDTRTADQIRCDELVHRVTFGAFGAPALQPVPDRTPAAGPAVTSGRWGRRGLSVGITMPLSTWLGLADEPGVLDGHGAIPGALARQIAADAARDHPGTTTWRCVIVDDRHRTVLGVGDLIPTPRHDPPARLARLIRTAEPTCVYPGCPRPAWRCDLDHRQPFEQGGATCSCNVQPQCRRHHRMKGSGMIKVRPVSKDEDPAAPPGTLAWSTWTGRTYRHVPPPVAVLPADPADVAHAAAVDAGRALHEALENRGTTVDDTLDWDRAADRWRRAVRRRDERLPRSRGQEGTQAARSQRRADPDAPAPF